MIRALITVYDDAGEEMHVDTISLDDELKTRDVVRFRILKPTSSVSATVTILGATARIRFSRIAAHETGKCIADVQAGEWGEIDWGGRPVVELLPKDMA